MEAIIKKNLKTVFYWVIGLIILLALVLLYVFYTAKPAPGPNNQMTEEQKQEMMNQLVAGSNTDMTEEQKLEAMNSLSGGSPTELSPEDKQKMSENLAQ